jgi:hypothetical protein
LNGNVADVGVIAGNENHIWLACPDGRELGRIILVACRIDLPRHDLAAELLECFREFVLKPHGVRGSLIVENGRFLGLQTFVLARELRAHQSLKRIDEADSKNHIADFGHGRVCRRGRDHRHAVFLTNGRSGQRQTRSHFAEHRGNFVARDQSSHGRARFA